MENSMNWRNDFRQGCNQHNESKASISTSSGDSSTTIRTPSITSKSKYIDTQWGLPQPPTHTTPPTTSILPSSGESPTSYHPLSHPHKYIDERWGYLHHPHPSSPSPPQASILTSGGDSPTTTTTIITTTPPHPLPLPPSDVIVRITSLPSSQPLNCYCTSYITHSASLYRCGKCGATVVYCL
jgi:hypothetical protein